VIKSFRHSALKKFFEAGKAKGIPADMAKRLRIRLDFLNRATLLEDVNLPGWKLHSLKGQRKGETRSPSPAIIGSRFALRMARRTT